MLKMRITNKFRKYKGFNLKPGFAYGVTETGTPVASSGWTVGEWTSLYVRVNGQWELYWTEPSNFPLKVQEKFLAENQDEILD